MVGRHGEDPLHHAQLEPAQARNDGRFVGGAHHQVGTPVAQRFPGAGEDFVGNPQGDAGGERVEGMDDRQQRFEFQDLVGNDPQPVFPATGHLVDPAGEPGHIEHQARRFLGQQMAGRGELQAVATAVEQQGVEARLQLPGRVGDRGGCFAQPGSGPRQAAASADRLEQGQFVRRQHVRSFRTSSPRLWHGKGRTPGQHGLTAQRHHRRRSS